MHVSGPHVHVLVRTPYSTSSCMYQVLMCQLTPEQREAYEDFLCSDLVHKARRPKDTAPQPHAAGPATPCARGCSLRVRRLQPHV